MRYLLLIYGDESRPQGSEEEQAKEMQAWFDYTEELRQAGVLVAGDALHPTATATTVRVRNDETLTTDGPFAETKEALGGYYLLDTEDLDAAIGWAAKCPGARSGSIELRPVMEFDETPPS